MDIESLKEWAEMGFDEWIKEYIESKPKKEITKNTESTDDTSKNGHADDRVRRLTEKQRELREHIDDEFIDINGYMLKLVEDTERRK